MSWRDVYDVEGRFLNPETYRAEYEDAKRELSEFHRDFWQARQQFVLAQQRFRALQSASPERLPG